jgi:predicted outer membrane repeat protein
MLRALRILALVLAMLSDGHRSAEAAGVVGAGTPESCTGNAFAAALAGGGLVSFDCGSAPVTILVDTAVILDGVESTVDGGGRITLDGESLRQLFLVLAGGELTLRDIKLRHGFAGTGGAIRNDGTTIIERVNLSDNQADLAGGGAIYSGGTLGVSDSTFFANTVPSAGGALAIVGGFAVITRSTLVTNFAESGGGVFIAGGTLILSNDTLTTNSAEKGGGLFVDGGEAFIVNATFDRNNADNGGGLFYEGTVVVANSVFSRSLNRQQNSASLECDGTGASITSNGGNLADDGSCQFDQVTDQNATAPELGDLADNGGPTLTILPLPGSLLIDGGVLDRCESVDQRGFARPADGDHDGAAGCDIGAVEVPEPAPLLASVAAVIGLAIARAQRMACRKGFDT